MQLQPELGQAHPAERALRRHMRHLYSVPIKLLRIGPNPVRITHGVTLDISEGGFAAVVEENLNTGETIRFNMPLPALSLDAMAVVRYASSSRSGFEFLNLSPEARQQIAAAGAAYES
jgi:PilZ domain